LLQRERWSKDRQRGREGERERKRDLKESGRWMVRNGDRKETRRTEEEMQG